MNVNLILGDCLEEMKKMPDKSIDLVLTSPPYNKNGFRGHRDNSKGKGRWSGADITYGSYLDDRNEEEYKSWQINILNECYRIIKNTGSIFYNHKVRRASGGASHPMEWITKCKAKFYQQIIWDRGGTPDHNIGYLDPTTELLFWLCKDTPKFIKNKNYATEVWRIPALPTPYDHPAPYPEKLCNIIVGMSTDKEYTILDPFMGSGTTGVACVELGRNFIGVEICEKYFDIAKKRIENAQAQGRLFV